jgi:predicted nucleic-acid-binding protein
MRYIDTNIFLRFLTEEKENLPQGLLEFFQNLQEGSIKVKCLDIVFFQVIFVLKSFYKVDKDEIIKVMKNILSLNGLYIKNKRILERTLELWEKHSDDIIDCYIVANMEQDGENELYTFDKKIKILGVKTIAF